jgi:hypothetical protein
MNSVFSYVNYRRFLKDYYQQAKAEKKYFSYRYFSRRAGINSPNFLKVVIEGKRNLSSRTIDKFAGALGLDKKETVFFRRLVVFNQAKTASEKQESYIILREMANQMRLHADAADFPGIFDTWYGNVVRELMAGTVPAGRNPTEETGNGGELIYSENTHRRSINRTRHPRAGSFSAAGTGRPVRPLSDTAPDHPVQDLTFGFRGSSTVTLTTNRNSTVTQFVF